MEICVCRDSGHVSLHLCQWDDVVGVDIALAAGAGKTSARPYNWHI